MSVDLVSTSETNVTVSLDPAANSLDGELLGELQRDLSKLSPRAGHRAVRIGVAGRPQHPRHPAQARRCVRAVRGAEGLSREPGRERSQLHVRRRREPGRPAGRAAARAADPPGTRATACWDRRGSSCSHKPGTAATARTQPWWAQKRDDLAGVRWRSATAPTSTTSRRSMLRQSRSRGIKSISRALLRDEGESASGHPAQARRSGCSVSSASRWRRSSTC